MQQFHIISKIPYFKLFFGVLTINICIAQGITKNIRYELESGIYLSTSGQNPFLLRSNQYGIVPLESQFLTLRGATRKEYDSTKNEQNNQKRFSYGYGLNTVVNAGKVNQIILPEAYLKVRYGAFEFYGGRRREMVGLVDTTLTSGSYIWSGNALPIPKLQISIPNYISIIGKGLISVKGAYAHGWFGSSDSTKNFFLHQKYLYGRIGKPNWRIKMYAGFNHQVQWGGRPDKPYIEKQTGKLITNYGNDLKTYWDVVSGVSLNTKESKDLAGVPTNEAWNRSGNHLGSVDVGIEFNFQKSDIFIYRQSIYDDGSLYYLNNINDGLLGVSWKKIGVNKGVVGVNFEYLNTTNQGGIIGGESTIPQLRGLDNYFNNSFYTWQYQNKTIGSPFLVPSNSVKEDLNKNSIPSPLYVHNNVNQVTIKLKYLLKDYIFYSQLSYYRITNLKKDAQIGFSQNLQKKIKTTTLNISISYDSDVIFKSGLGFSFKIIKYW